MRGFYFITDDRLSKSGTTADVASAVKAKVVAVQYRAKNLTLEAMVAQASTFKALCKDIPFIVNDFIDVAIAVDANGVHLGENDTSLVKARKALGPQKLIGVSVANLSQAVEAQAQGADYLGVGPIFATTTKLDARTPCGTQLITLIKQKCHIPIVAIGGINDANARQVVQAGADAICAISATVGAKDVKKAIEGFQVFFNQEEKNG